MQLIRHTPVTQQQRLVPIPIYVEVNPNVSVGQVVLFYRTIGESVFQQIQMEKHYQGYAATIGCDVLTTFDPTGIEYYVAVLDPSNQLLGTSGTEGQPHRVSIVDTLTVSPPTLPNQPPPAQCAQEECPPWNPNCHGECKQFGDLCDSDSECCAGMVCVNETCTQEGEEGGGGVPGDFDPVMRFALSVGTGVGLVFSGAEKPYNQTSDGKLSIGTGLAWNKFHFRFNPMFYLPAEDIQIGATFRGEWTFDQDDDAPKFGPAGLANLSYRLKGEGHDGFQLLLLTGLGYAEFYHRVVYQDCETVLNEDTDELQCNKDDMETTEEGDIRWNGENPVEKVFFREGGKFAIEAGFDGYYWFTSNFGLNFGLIFDFLVPDVAINLDVNFLVSFRF